MLAWLTPADISEAAKDWASRSANCNCSPPGRPGYFETPITTAHVRGGDWPAPAGAQSNKKVSDKKTRKNP